MDGFGLLQGGGMGVRVKRTFCGRCGNDKGNLQCYIWAADMAEV